MNFILEVSDYDTKVVGLVENEHLAEQLVIEEFDENSEPGDELVGTIHDGILIYTLRRKIEEIIDKAEEFEYVDNDGNPIVEDGLEIVDESPMYDYPDEYLWVVGKANMGERTKFSSASVSGLVSGCDINPFENSDGNIVVIKTA